MRRPERQRKEYRTWQQCENRCIAAGSRLSYTLQDGQKGNPGYQLPVSAKAVIVVRQLRSKDLLRVLSYGVVQERSRVHDSKRMLKAAVHSSWINLVCPGELPDAPQTLKRSFRNNVALPGIQLDEPVYRTSNLKNSIRIRCHLSGSTAAWRTKGEYSAIVPHSSCKVYNKTSSSRRLADGPRTQTVGCIEPRTGLGKSPTQTSAADGNAAKS